MNTHKPNPRRAELRALSAQIRPAVKAGLIPNVNAGLLALYRQETGQTDFRTFHDWRKANRPVKKGEKGFPIWATPRRMENGEAIGGDLATLAAMSGIEPQGREWFPVAYLFHAGQVEPEEQPQLALQAGRASPDFVFVLLIVVYIVTACAIVLQPKSSDGCTTDTECAAYCPPPADDPECDGGPQ